MRTTLILLLVAAASLSGCQNSPAPPANPGSAAPATSSTPADAVQQKLQELAGNGATDCGRYKSQAPEQMKAASDCAVKAAQEKHPFYVAYEMPGLIVGVAGNGEGKLYALQAQPGTEGKPGGMADVKTAPCPSELRVAQSGRVTCVTPGSMGMEMGGSSPHGAMPMPAGGGQSPHGGMGMPPPGTPNPHGKMPVKQPPKQ